MQERRVFERINAPMKVRYEILQKAPGLKPASSKDISGTGIRLSLDEELDVGTDLKLEIELPERAKKTAIVYGTVSWCRKIEISGVGKAASYYETGIRFTRADPIILGAIYKYFEKINDR